VQFTAAGVVVLGILATRVSACISLAACLPAPLPATVWHSSPAPDAAVMLL
jgi:hypothetical protein